MQNKIKGGLFGVAVGDALGAALEFMTAEEIEEQYGQVETILGGGWLNLEPGQVTDDTMMTIGVARGVLTNPGEPVQEVGNEFVRWYQGNPPDIGNSCRASIEYFLEKGDWMVASELAHQRLGKSAGNGSLMRTLPIAIAYRHDLERMLEVTYAISKMTHWEEMAAEACQIYSCLVLAYLGGREEKESLVAQMLELYPSTSGLLDLRNLPPSGYVRDTLYHVLTSFIRTDSFADCLIRSVNLGGDADTIGAIAGGIAGVYYGYDAIPAEWIEQLDGAIREELTELSERLTNCILPSGQDE